MFKSLFLALALSACATISSGEHQICLPLVGYTKTQQDMLAQELLLIDKNSQIIRFLNDYEAMRQADRACSIYHQQRN